LGSEGAVVVKGEPGVMEEAVTAVMEEEQSKEMDFEKPAKQQRKRKPSPAAEQEEVTVYTGM